jgi:hypothetical protein
MVSDSDRRYLEWMRKQIDAYDRSELGLAGLIGDLESLVGQMESLSVDDRQEFVGHWGDLEQVYAVVLDRGMEQLDDVGMKIVNDAIDNIKHWIERMGSSAESLGEL